MRSLDKGVLGLAFFVFLQFPYSWALPNRDACIRLESEFLSGADHTQIKTDSFMVSKGPTILMEWYDGISERQGRHPLWSVSKSVITLVAGAMAKKGIIALDDPVEKYIDYKEREAVLPNSTPEDRQLFSQLTIRHLINMNSSLSWSEGFSDKPSQSSIFEMLYGSGRRDMPSFVLSRPFLEPGPGKIWKYSTGDMTLLAQVLYKANSPDRNQFESHLFQPLGIVDSVLERDAKGNPLGGSHYLLNTNDLMKLGQLILFNGKWQGVQVLPEDWVDFAKTISPGELNPDTKDDFYEANWAYGGGIWLNVPIKNAPPAMPHAPQSTLFAAGLFGQYLLVFPEQELVVVRTGHDLGQYSNSLDLFVNRILGCFGDTEVEQISFDSLLPRKGPSLDYSEIFHFIRSGKGSSMIAKEFCSCHYVSGLPIEECKRRSKLPKSFFDLVKIEVSNFQIVVDPSALAYATIFLIPPHATGFLDPKHPYEGCRLQ